MAKDTKIYGKRCRWNSRYYAWVSDDGLLAAMPKTKELLPIQVDSDGRKYVVHGWSSVGLVYIDMAVITCFCPPMPISSVKKYDINFKDGNKQNCHYKNLEWKAVPYKHATGSTAKVQVQGETLTVKKDGTVRQGKTLLSIRDYTYDSDTDLYVCIEPHAYFNRKNSIHYGSESVDELMKKAGFVGGDHSILERPVILHKDNDRQNFSSDNLEWTEETDPRYQAYTKQKTAEMHARNVELNPGKTLHPGM